MDVCVRICVCLPCFALLCSARRCWLFLLESCCVSGTVTAVSSANVISCSVGCESISFRGTITEDCRFFFFFHPSNHNIWIKSLCTAQHTVPESKHISCSVLWSCDVSNRPFPREKELFANCYVCFSFPQFKTHSKNIPSIFPFSALFSGSINTTHDLGELWLWAFTLSGQGSQTILWMDGR